MLTIALPKNTLIYCAHEYTKANILWALNLKPKYQDLKNKLSEVEKKLSLNELTIPFLLEEEMKINLFLKAKNLEEFTFLRENKVSPIKRTGFSPFKKKAICERVCPNTSIIFTSSPKMSKISPSSTDTF